MRIHHGDLGAILIILCIFIYLGIGFQTEVQFYVWVFGLILGVVMLVHDVYWHLTHRKSG